MPSERRVARDNLDDQGHRHEDDHGKRDAAKLVHSQHEKQHALRAEEQLEEGHLSLLDVESQTRPAAASAPGEQDHDCQSHTREDSAGGGGEVERGEQRV